MASLWVDKHRPTTFTKLSLHSSITPKLQSLARSSEIPHLLFYGPAGAGKKTRVMALLREIYGAGVEKVKLEHRSFKTSTNRVIEVTTIGSNYHIECNPTDAGSSDRFVVQEVIKEIASHGTLQSGTGGKGFKVLVLTEVDQLSKQAQAGLRRTMEKYSSTCRIFLICNSASKIIEPLRSRCLGIRIPSPTLEEVSNLVMNVAKKEQYTCDIELCTKIAIHADGNVRRALLMLEAAKVQNQTITNQKDIIVQLPDWEIFIVRIAREILQEQSPTKLLQVRDMLYELLTNCIPVELILQNLTKELIKTMDDGLKHDIVYWSAYYNHRVCQGSKEIFHLEAFVAKVMAIYKKWLVSMFS